MGDKSCTSNHRKLNYSTEEIEKLFDEIKVIKQYIEITNRDILDYKPPDLHASN
jgi:hypothetical protein